MNKKWEMLNGSTCWITKKTLLNAGKIYDYIKQGRAQSRDPKKYRVTFSDVSQNTGIGRQQVQTVVYMLSFKVDPVLRVHAKSFRGPTGGRIAHKIELLREL